MVLEPQSVHAQIRLDYWDLDQLALALFLSIGPDRTVAPGST